MTKQEIENLKLEDCAVAIFALLGYNGELVPSSNYKKDENVSDDVNYFNSLGIDNPNVTQVIETLESYKAQLLVSLRQNWKDYFNANMGYYPDAMIKAGIGLDGNAKVKIMSLIEKDSVLLEVIREQCELDKAEAKKESDEAKVFAHGEGVVDACNKMISFIAGYNNLKGFTGEQLDQIQVKYASVMIALSSYRPAKALALMLDIEPDENYNEEDVAIIKEKMESFVSGIPA